MAVRWCCFPAALVASALLTLPVARGLLLQPASPASKAAQDTTQFHIVRTVARSETPSHQNGGKVSSLQCNHISKALKTNPETRLAGLMFQSACESDYGCSANLPDMSDGCLYVPSTRHLKQVLEVIGRPNPCGFIDLFVNTYFHPENCHHKKAPYEHVASVGGLTYRTCTIPTVPQVQLNSGFGVGVGIDRHSDQERIAVRPGLDSFQDSCVETRRVSKAYGGVASPDVFVVDGAIGLPKYWELAMLTHEQRQRSPGEVQKRMDYLQSIYYRSPVFVQNMSEQPLLRMQQFRTSAIKVKFHACLPWGMEETLLRKQVKAQVDVLQRAYQGQISCEDNMYAPAQGGEDTGIRFESFADEDLAIIQDDACDYCDKAYEQLWSNHFAQVETNVFQVLLCSTDSILGTSGFPWESKTAPTLIDLKTLPMGTLVGYNEGKTLVHELGHHLGLYHTFQFGCEGFGDQVEDTNREELPFFGCPSKYNVAPTSCEEDIVDPIYSFMDYTDDRCMCMFTKGQAHRLQLEAQRFRRPYVSAP